jgi:PAS domain S-box-containing protein
MAGVLLPAALVVVGVALVAGAFVHLTRRNGSGDGLAVGEMDRLRRAELALASASSPEAAARELGKHAMALLDAPAAVVLLEGVGDTVRMEVGDTTGHSIYEPGSRMRLLSTDDVPCGSIAVAARPDRPYTERDERILDALGERVSSTFHRLALFEAVRAEQQTLADVLGSSSDGIFSVGPDLRVRSWNPAMARLTGVTPVVAVGQSCCAVFRPLDESGGPLFGATCPCRTGDQAELLVQLSVAHDMTLWLNCAFSPMSDDGFVVVARDVTTRKQIEDEKADFLATVSHELRTPLTPIKGFLQTLIRRDREFADDERQHIYDVMLREEQRLERLVHQLLQATSLDQAEHLIVPETLDWSQAVHDQVDQMRRADPTREFSVVFAPDVPAVIGDEQLAGQVLANLLSNAVKFSPVGTPVGVGVAHDGHRVITTVADHGPGVAPADRDRIFEKFTRLGNHLTRPQQGVGLGLYIVRRSVEAMGGTVWVDPAPGGGAAFSFSLPAAPRMTKVPATSA